MDFRVRVVGGIESCYVSLPLSLIERLDSSRPSSLSHVFAIELRPSSSTDPHRMWHVAWSGSASSSVAIEVAQQFAECIGLPDGTVVSVRAIPNVPKATYVTVEPYSEDDWEVLELNAGAAEAAILSQVRIVHVAMRFPLWLHGQTMVTFLVVETVPNNAVVQLMPGTEVAVEPKRRRRYENCCKDSHMQSVDGPYSLQSVLLRVQDPKKMLMHKSNVAGVDIGIELSSIILLHPETGKKYSFDPLQVVKIMPRFSSKVKEVNGSGKDGNLRRRHGSSSKEPNDVMSEHELEYAVVQVLFSETVAKGHVMLSLSLRCYLRSGLHSWIFVQRWVSDLKKNLPILSVSPCQFVRLGKSRDSKNNGLEEASHQLMPKIMLQHHSGANVDTPDWFAYHELASAVPRDVFKDNKEASFPSNARNMVYSLIHVWLMAQCDAIKSISAKEAVSVVIGRQTFLHFEMIAFGDSAKPHISTMDSSERRRGVDESVNDFFFALSISDKQLHGKSLQAYEFSFGKNGVGHVLNFDTENMVLEDPVSFQYVKEEAFAERFRPTLSDLNWMSEAASDATNRLRFLLSPGSDFEHSDVKFPFPGHVLIYGPPGSGKSLLASAVAKFFEESDLLVHIIFVCCSALASEKFTNIRQDLHNYLSDALDHSPSLIVFDDFDSIFASAFDSEGSQASASLMVLSESIIGFMDEYQEKKINSCGLGSVAFLGCVRSLDSIPQSLRAPGRFDFHIQLPSPAASERMGILKHEIQKRSLQCSDDTLHQIAFMCDGYDAYDLEMLVHRSVHVATSRFLPSYMAIEEGRPSLIADDFMQAMNQFLPLSMRDMAKSAPNNNGLLGWGDVGGLANVQNAIKEIIEIPSKFPTIFVKSPLRLRSNVLLYGPPGCGKTYIVGAAAAASSLRFISIKGPELLNKYIGASEEAVRDVFAKAAAAAPCLLFFDEFDSIAPKRGHDNTGVTDRVVNQFLTELDGVEVLTGVFVFAATSRPDLLDAALLRPGRLDRLLFCDFPSLNDRLEILTVLSRKLPLADNVDMMTIARMTEGFSGADLQALLSDAQLSAVQELLDSLDLCKSKKSPVITNELLKQLASKARPSVSDFEKQKLYGIYSQFLDTKRSIAAQSRDKKGKRATLA